MPLISGRAYSLLLESLRWSNTRIVARKWCNTTRCFFLKSLWGPLWVHLDGDQGVSSVWAAHLSPSLNVPLSLPFSYSFQGRASLFSRPLGPIQFVFHKGGMCMCVTDASQSHLMDKHPQDKQPFQRLRWRSPMKCNCSLCFSSPAALLGWSGSHKDMASCFSPKMSEVRRKLCLPVFGEMALERKFAKRFMVILLEWPTAFW